MLGLLSRIDKTSDAYDENSPARLRHSVVMRNFEFLLSSWREQKKEVNGTPASSSRSQIVYAMVVLPKPASPVSQYTEGAFVGSVSFAHAIIFSMMSTRVPSVHGPREAVARLMEALKGASSEQRRELKTTCYKSQ